MTPVPERTPDAQVAPDARPRFAKGQRVQIVNAARIDHGISTAFIGGYGHVVDHRDDTPPVRWAGDAALDHLVELHPKSPGAELLHSQHGLWFAGSELEAID